MREDYERRAYRRSDDFHCSGRVSKDGVNWRDTQIYDLSSGGLRFHAPEPYEIGDTAWFDLLITGFFTEFEVKVQGVVRRKITTRGKETFGVSFEGLSQDLRIRIDEAVQNFKPKGLLF